MTKDEIFEKIASGKLELDRQRPLKPSLLTELQTQHDIDLTYSSNAIEGNTLTLRETAEVIEHGITVGGKKLRDHLEAVDHYDAIQWMREQAALDVPLGETTVTELHRRIVLRSNPEIAGIYSRNPRRIAGSSVIFPNAAKVPYLMEAFGVSLRTLGLQPRDAFDAHYRLVSIHPFADGNGRTARLLMNFLLLRSGYPPIAVRPEDRAEYLDALEHAQIKEDVEPFQLLMHRRLGDTLDAYLALFQEGLQGDAKAAARAAFAAQRGLGH